MYTLQQRIRPSTSAFISSIWLNDQTLATANLEGQISLFQGSQLSQEHIIDATRKKASLIALHALDCGQTLVSCSFDGAVRSWKPKDPSQPDSWNECVCEDSFAPIDLMTTATDGESAFANTQTNGTIMIHSIEGDRFCKEKSTFSPSGSNNNNIPITALHFASSQRLVLGKATGAILLADLSTGRTIQSLNGHERQPIQALDHSNSNSALLLSGARDGAVCLWDSRAACVANVFVTGKDGWIGKVQFNPSASNAYFLATYAGANGAVSCVRYWDIRAGNVAHSWEVEGLNSLYPQAEIAPTGDKICVFSQKESAGIYRIPM